MADYLDNKKCKVFEKETKHLEKRQSIWKRDKAFRKRDKALEKRRSIWKRDKAFGKNEPFVNRDEAMKHLEKRRTI